MKKIVILLIFILATGCNNSTVSSDISFNTDDYNIFMPYKEAVTSSFAINNEMNNYDPEIINNDLMMLSTNYFKTNNSFYQNPQYLTKEKIKEVLELLNRDDDVFVAIQEQDYLASNGNLKGISFGLVINPYFKNNESGYTYSKKEITDEFIRDNADKFIKKMRQISALEDIRIMVGIFYLNEPNKVFPGTYKYLGITSDNKVNLNKLDYNYYYLQDDFVANNNMNTYQMFEELKKQITNVNKLAIVSGNAIYNENEIKRIEIKINGSFTKPEIIYISNIIADAISSDLIMDAKITAKIFINDDIASIVEKDSGSIKTTIDILRG